MSRIAFSDTIENDSVGDAAELMRMLNAIKDGGNAIDDTNIGSAGISESKIVFSVSGHDHDGVGSSLAALAVNAGAQGTVKVRRAVASGLGLGAFSGNLNPAGSGQIDTVLGVRVLLQTNGAASGDGRSFHTGTLPGTSTTVNSYSSRYEGGVAPATGYGWYVIVNTSVTPNEVYVYIQTMAAACDALVMMVGI